MNTPVLLVITALTAAILLAATVLIAAGTRGDEGGGAVIREQRLLQNPRQPVRDACWEADDALWLLAGWNDSAFSFTICEK